MAYPKILIPVFLSVSFFVHAQVPENPDSISVFDGIFEKVEYEAYYPGGESAWVAYLQKNLKAEAPVNNGAPVGKYTVIVQFIVGKDGKVADIKALTRLGYGMEQEVIRIIRNSGAWVPAIQYGKPVNAYRRQPVTFVVEQDGLNIISETEYTLYAGVDNELTIQADKLKPADLSVTISKGTITPTARGTFIARVKETEERIIVRVYNAKKKNKEIGAVSFEVKASK